MSILETIKQWLTTVCELLNPPDWIGEFIDISSVVLLWLCILGVICLVFHVLRWIFTFGGK